MPAEAALGSSDEGDCLTIRRANFEDRVRFHAPGFRRFKTREYAQESVRHFVTLSVTGSRCALNCDHCGTVKLRGMKDLPEQRFDLYEMCKTAKEAGARGVLISGGCDAQGRVPLLRHVPALVRVREELGLIIRVHPGLVDEPMAKGLAEVGIDGAMMDIIGHDDTIRDVYHIDGATTADFEAGLAHLDRHGVPMIPHIICGLHYGRMLGEWEALEIIARHPPKLLVLVVLTPLAGTKMAEVPLPDVDELGGFFRDARRRLPETPIMLGCARPLGPVKKEIDRHALLAGFNGIAYPAEGSVALAKSLSLSPEFVDACCGVTW